MKLKSAVPQLISDRNPMSLLIAVILGVMFYPVFRHLADYGWQAADYTHGYFIMPVFLWLLYRLRKDLKIRETGSAGGWVLFGLGMAVYLFASMNTFMFLEAFSLILVLGGVMRIRLTDESFAKMLFPLGYLLFLVPPPSLVIDMLTFPLKKISITGSWLLLNWTGFKPVMEGAILKVGPYELFVSEACSGFRSMIALLSLGAVYAYVQKTSTVRKTVLFFSVIPLGIAGNILRIFITGVISHYAGIQFAEGFFHGFSSALIFLVTIAGLILLTERLTGERFYEAR